MLYWPILHTVRTISQPLILFYRYLNACMHKSHLLACSACMTCRPACCSAQVKSSGCAASINPWGGGQVDVEDKQSGAWHTLTPYDGGLSGWRLLWDRMCPVPSLRFGKAAPRYRELVNALSWIAHSQNLRRMCQDYRVDLYLRPPHIAAFKLMDYHLIDRIVRTSYRSDDSICGSIM